MKYCHQCGEKLNSQATYCHQCGEKQEKEFSQNNSSKIRLASSNKRLLNYFIDYLFGVYGSSFLAGIIIGLLGIATGEEDGFFLLVLIGPFCYFFLTEINYGKTLGKFLTKTKVVMKDGGPITSKAIFFRTVFRFIPFEAFSFLGNRPEGWHDKWSHTIVIEDE